LASSFGQRHPGGLFIVQCGALGHQLAVFGAGKCRPQKSEKLLALPLLVGFASRPSPRWPASRQIHAEAPASAICRCASSPGGSPVERGAQVVQVGQANEVDQFAPAHQSVATLDQHHEQVESPGAEYRRRTVDLNLARSGTGHAAS
jgi:hypothetical protein